MTATGDAPTDLEASPDLASSESDAPPERIHQVCPYLQGEGGGWRSLQPTRDHRCAAMQPPAEPAVAKQRDLCLQPSHVSCATYLAARVLEDGDEPDPRVDAGLWPTTNQSVLALEPARASGGSLPRGATRTGGQALLAGLIALAFLVLVVARTTPSGAASPDASLAAGAGASQPIATVAPASPAASPLAPASASPDPSTAPASPSATPGPSAPGATTTPSAPPSANPATTYRVKSGDTLSSIAIAHGVTVRQLRKANGLDGNVIRPGQELVIP